VISRRRLHLVITLLLPLMALRAFMPAGYMVAPVVNAAHGATQWALVMCREGMLPRADSGADQPGPGQHQPGTDDTDHCAFAATAAVPLPAEASWSQLVPSFMVHLVSAAADQLPPATGPPRQAPARAPPPLHA
jgi:hypothetical protein